MLPAASIRRLFILRPDNLGDLVLFSGTLKHFRRRWPAAQITLCVRGSYGVELFAHCPHVDRLVSYEELRTNLLGSSRLFGMPQVRGFGRLGNLLRQHAPGLIRRKYASDLVVLPIRSAEHEYHRCIKLIPSRDKVGICGNLTNQTAEIEAGTRNWYSTQMNVAGRPWNFPELEATRLFLTFLDIEVEPDELWPELWTSRDDCRKANNWIPKNSHKIVLGIAPGVTSVPGKRLPSEWFAKVVNLLKCRDIEIILLGSRPDLSVCEGVASALKSSRPEIRLQNLAGKTSVGELIECIRRCNIVLSQETAALHIATALRKPVVGIIGGGHFGRFYPWGDPNVSRAVNKPMDCYGCNWRCKYESIRCIQEISVESAAAEMNYLLRHLTPRSVASLVS